VKYIVMVPSRREEDVGVWKKRFKDFFDPWDSVVYVPHTGHDVEIRCVPSDPNPNPAVYKPNTVPRDIINGVMNPDTGE
jgi:hypothetical protein